MYVLGLSVVVVHTRVKYSIRMKDNLSWPILKTEVILSHNAGVSRDLIALDLPGRCEWERLSYTVREAVHSPVKVNDQLGDAYKQVVKCSQTSIRSKFSMAAMLHMHRQQVFDP